MVAINFSKAFYTVNTTTLLDKVSESPLAPSIKRWLNSYLRGRKASVLYHGAQSPKWTLFAGVPQGSCISPTTCLEKNTQSRQKLSFY